MNGERESLFASRGFGDEIERFIRDSPYAEFVPGVPQAPVYEWGSIAWARLALELIRDNERAYDAYQDLANGGAPQ